MSMEVDGGAGAPSGPSQVRYSYEPNWPMYSLAWSPQPDRIRLAVGSFLEKENNHIRVIEVNEEKQCLESVAEDDHPFPATKLMWRPTPAEAGQNFEMLASTSTTLNVWRYEVGSSELKGVVKLANARTRGVGGYAPPLTSFDWSMNGTKIGASSVDSTCTIWNLEKQKIETQLIAHDKAVHDVVFSQKDCLFASVGADGSVRLFDQRNLDHSTIIYEAPTASPLLRLAWNRVNTYHIATIAMDCPGVILIDIRRPSVALCALTDHDCCVNAVSWAPHSRNHLLCGTSDGHGLIWDVREQPATATDPGKTPSTRRGTTDGSTSKMGSNAVFWHDCDHEVYQVQWPSSAPDHVALGTAKGVDIVPI